MYNNNLGFGGRGASNSIASPGISQLFGGGGTTASRPQTTNGSVPTGAGVQPAPFRPQTQDRAMTRYTPTYTSNAFDHAQYQAPLKNTESAAVRTLNTTGTSVEDYGRRNQVWDKAAFMQAHTAAGKAAAANTFNRIVIKADEADCPCCVNKDLIQHKKTQAQLDRESTMTAEQRRLAALRAEEDRELARKRTEREANQHEMNSTLYQINAQKRAEWEAKKNDTTNLQQTTQLNQEIQNLTLQSAEEKRQMQQQYKDELNRKKEQAIQQNINGKITDRELERRLKGLQFECYQRDPLMKEEAKRTGQAVKSQVNEWEQRKQREREDMVAPPEVFYTDKELAGLKAEAEARNQEMRAHNSTYARDQLNQHLTKQKSHEEERARQIAEERDHHHKLNKMQERDNMLNRRTRESRQQEMNSTLTHLERQKRAEWDSKKNDQTNKFQTQALNSEINALTQASLEDKWRQTQGYKQDLSSLNAAQRAKIEQDRNTARMEEAKAKGLTFECYARDPLMKEAAKETGTYQRTQKELEGLKRQQEREHLVQPPESLVTTEQLQALHQEAMNQENAKRHGLRDVMASQYHETLAGKQARTAAERAQDAEEAARTAARNSELSKIEREVAETTKNSYNQYLAHQLTDAEKRKQFEEAERKYDPNVERLIQENARIGERIVQCGKCDTKLSHERTVLGGAHSHH